MQLRAHIFPFLLALGRGMALSLACYGGLGVLVAGYMALLSGAPLADSLGMVARDWLPWAVATPLIFLLVWHLPLDGLRRWRVTLPAHLAVAALILAAVALWMDAPGAARRMGGGPGGAGSAAPPPQMPRLAFAPPHVLPPPNTEPAVMYLWQINIRLGAYPQRRMPRPGHPPILQQMHPAVFVLFMMGVRFPVYLAIAGVAHALYFYERAQEREKRSLGLEAGLARARLEALRMQLQPHFLFNSLNAIAELVHTDPDKADEMLVALSDLLRATLEKSDRQEIPLHQELEFVDRYLAMQKVRLADRLHIQRDIAPETRRALVPPFLLQPIVENSLRHGLEPLPGGGTLTLRSAVSLNNATGETVLRLSVHDSGAGIPVGAPPREGIGLTNTRARLRELYGRAASLRLVNRDGLTVEVELPLQLDPDLRAAAPFAAETEIETRPRTVRAGVSR
ncbi:hypothetical protein DB346_11900 [Verrucomicrobia bacterium LW23]|nr:hypothetical protein DB346_11900 [Verrucomicrobia bacterium LW23]